MRTGDTGVTGGFIIAILVSALCLSLSLSSAAYAQSADDLYEQGLVAYAEGKYTDAADFLTRAAQQGDVRKSAASVYFPSA